ncbi:hypothetical protein HMI01_13940 [Halolactibacillus miurensis]|uniref:Competence protein ComGG n=1 Tax=Halolactibacillus miurensis TaxID=306541 RepID=A0A1I6PRI5_9BACI|nr:hypothetical protein [Halolactibacillus miurensis]GEM04406.1 hypothetical protein HMI01_13940 [Halolactibacillus miurensis]SFS42804.1 hypothetical protein SAMN05421668_102160 [Halolactibacillus miurensis]
MTLSCPSLRDDQGSVTILALFVVIGLLLSLTSLTTVYLTEKQFTELERVQLNHHSLHQMTYQLVLNQVNQTEVPPAKFGQFTFPTGTTRYSLSKINNQALLYIDSQTTDTFSMRYYYALPEAMIWLTD